MSSLEVQVARLDERTETLETGHKETNVRVDKLATKMDRATWLVITTLAGVVATLAVALLKH